MATTATKLTAAQCKALRAIGSGAWVPVFHDAKASGFAPHRWGVDSHTMLHWLGLIAATPGAMGRSFAEQHVTLTDAGRAALAACEVAS